MFHRETVYQINQEGKFYTILFDVMPIQNIFIVKQQLTNIPIFKINYWQALVLE